jgi:hypothetical protein
MWTKEKIKEFAKVIGYHCQFTSGELNTLHTLLFDDEDCFGMTEGMLKKIHHTKHSGYGIALLSDMRFLFYHKSFFGAITREEFPISTISSISLQKGTMFSALHVYASNVDEIIVQPCDHTNAQRIVEAWQFLLNERNIISAAMKNEQSYRADETAFDPVSELEKWHSLKDRGIITQEEFDLKKRQLLNL